MNNKKRSTSISDIMAVIVLVGISLLVICLIPEKKRADGITKNDNTEEVQTEDVLQDSDRLTEDDEFSYVEGTFEQEVTANNIEDSEQEHPAANSNQNNGLKEENQSGNGMVSGEEVNQKYSSADSDVVGGFISLPYRIPDTELVLERINPYDGIFLEDGSDRNVQNVVAISVKNTSEQCAEYIDITLKQGERQLRFVGSALESGGTMILFETDAKNYQEGAYTECAAVVAWTKEMEQSEDVLTVTDSEDGGLIVTNIGKENIACVRIFYKYYMEDMDVYVGGITYTSKLINLASGTSQEVFPSHYLSDGSKVLMVKTYDTDL